MALVALHMASNGTQRPRGGQRRRQQPSSQASQGQTSEERVEGGNEENLQVIGQELVPASQELVPVTTNGVIVQAAGGEGNQGSELAMVVAEGSNGPLSGVDGTGIDMGINGDSGVAGSVAMTGQQEVSTPPQPTSVPQSFGPALFSPEQIHQMQTVARDVPILGGQPPVPGAPPLMTAPQVQQAVEGVRALLPPGIASGLASWWGFGNGPAQFLQEESWRMQAQQDFENMSLMLRAARRENERLRRELRSVRDTDVRSFATPEASYQDEEEAEGEDGTASREAVQQVEDGAASREAVQQERSGEDGAPSREGVQQGPRRAEDGAASREAVQQGSRSEDGAPSRE